MAVKPDSSDRQIRFLLGGKVAAVDNVEPTRTVLAHLRETLGRPGTKVIAAPARSWSASSVTDRSS
jgi:xanthine dehydrogenase iron-sulfur cluster and FAD-binding subunit A